jgi:hypothetical protein
MTTAYHAKYYAYDLTKIGPSTHADRLSTSLFNASVDLNPHQVEAALFAILSPLSKGVMLWCETAAKHELKHGGKSWRYVLIPHTEIKPSAKLAGILSRFGK